MEMKPALTVDALTKKYGSATAVDGISFEVPKGKIIGLLGPNGAGKTTTIQMLLGITLPTSGSIRYFDMDFAKNQHACLQRINYASAYNKLQERITVWENLIVFARLYMVPNAKQKIDELLDFFDMQSHKDDQYINLSAGESTRINLIKALLNDPELLLLDEPTASLDPDIADRTLSLIEKLRAECNLSILFTSHNMNEVTRICDEVIILDKGSIVRKDEPTKLARQSDKVTLALTIAAFNTDVQSYLKKHKLHHKRPFEHILEIQTRQPKLAEVIESVSKHVRIDDIDIQKPTLEDVFLEIARGNKS